MSNLNDITTIEIKIGSTFYSDNGAFTQDGVAVDLTGMTFESEVRDLKHVLVATITINVIDAPSGIISVDGEDTSTWPQGRLLWDIKATRDGQTVYTETVAIVVVESVTQ